MKNQRAQGDRVRVRRVMQEETRKGKKIEDRDGWREDISQIDWLNNILHPLFLSPPPPPLILQSSVQTGPVTMYTDKRVAIEFEMSLHGGEQEEEEEEEGEEEAKDLQDSP